MKFRYYIIDEYENVEGTNSAAVAKAAAEDQTVIDSEEGVTVGIDWNITEQTTWKL